MTKANKFTNNFRTYWQCQILRKEILWASPEYTPNLLVVKFPRFWAIMMCLFLGWGGGGVEWRRNGEGSWDVYKLLWFN